MKDLKVSMDFIDVDSYDEQEEIIMDIYQLLDSNRKSNPLLWHKIKTIQVTDKPNMFEEISDALKPVFNKFDGVMEKALRMKRTLRIVVEYDCTENDIIEINQFKGNGYDLLENNPFVNGYLDTLESNSSFPDVPFTEPPLTDKDRQLKELKKRLKKAYQKLGKIEYGYNCLNKFDVIDKYPCQRINHLRDNITSLKQQIKELKCRQLK